MPVDYTFPEGHRIGIVLIANLNALQRNGPTGTTITLNTKQSTVSLPIVGGFDAAVSAGAFADTTAVTQPVGGTVPATLALSLRGPATFGTFTPGIDKEYTATTDATVTSSAGDADADRGGPRPPGQRRVHAGRSRCGRGAGQGGLDRPDRERRR